MGTAGGGGGYGANVKKLLKDKIHKLREKIMGVRLVKEREEFGGLRR